MKKSVVRVARRVMRSLPFLLAAVLLRAVPGEGAVIRTVHDAGQVLAENIRVAGGRSYFVAPDGSQWELVTDIDDPAISNPGSGTWCPVPSDYVEEALDQVSDDLGTLHVDVYILPYPRRNLLASSAGRGVIYLSPGVYPYSRQPAHALVVHELGHVLHLGSLPEGDPGWQRYREIRGITDTAIFNENAPHKDRPHEIFAEDFRVLFGGALANYSGTWENRDLPDPWLVPELRDFLVDLTTAGRSASAVAGNLEATLNPFRSTTALRFVLTAAAPARIDLVALDGRLVRQLGIDAGGPGEVTVAWDGKDGSGRPVAAGIYFARVVAGGTPATLKLVRIP